MPKGESIVRFRTVISMTICSREDERLNSSQTSSCTVRYLRKKPLGRTRRGTSPWQWYLTTNLCCRFYHSRKMDACCISAGILYNMMCLVSYWNYYFQFMGCMYLRAIFIYNLWAFLFIFLPTTIKLKNVL